MKTVLFSFLLVSFSCLFTAQQDKGNSMVKEYLTETSDGTTLYTKVSGTGDYCIYVHGGPGMWSQSFENLKGKNLETRLKMVYYDQRGSGRSAASVSGDYSVARMVDDIEEVRKKAGARKIYLMAHSFGGIIAVSYAHKYGAHLKGLILVNSTLYLKNSVESQIQYVNGITGSSITIQNDQYMSALGEAMQKLSEKDLHYKMLTDHKENFEILNRIDEGRPEENGFRNTVWSLDEYYGDFTGITSGISIPVLVIAGRKDHAVGPLHHQLFRFPNQTVAEIDGGHLLYNDNNPEFIEQVFGFVKKTGTGSGDAVDRTPTADKL